MPNESRFSKLPNRIVVPIETPRRRTTRAELVVSFTIAVILVAFATLASCCLKGC
jgi:hypothetical protein